MSPLDALDDTARSRRSARPPRCSASSTAGCGAIGSAPITQARYVIAVPDLERSGAFYRDVLGFTVREIGDDGFRFFESGACVIFAGACPDAPPAHAIGDHSYFAYLVVDDVDAYHARSSRTAPRIVKALGRRAVGHARIRPAHGGPVMLERRRSARSRPSGRARGLLGAGRRAQ